MDTTDNTQRDANEEPGAPPATVVQNPNPRANENIQVRTNEPKTQGREHADGVGSEITDGEEA